MVSALGQTQKHNQSCLLFDRKNVYLYRSKHASAWVDQIPGARARQQALDALRDRPVVLDSTGIWREPGDVILGGGLSEAFVHLLDLRIAKNPRLKQAREFLEGSLGVNQLDVGSVVRRVAKVVDNLDDGFDEEHEDFGRHDQLLGILRSVWDVDSKAFKNHDNARSRGVSLDS